MSNEQTDEAVEGRRLKILRAVAYCWYREQRCYWARLKRMLPARYGCGETIWRDVQQLVHDGFLEKETMKVSQGRIQRLRLTESGWQAIGRAEELFD